MYVLISTILILFKLVYPVRYLIEDVGIVLLLLCVCPVILDLCY